MSKKKDNKPILVNINNNYKDDKHFNKEEIPKNCRNSFNGELYANSDTLKQLNLISFKEQTNSYHDKDRLIIRLSSKKNNDNKTEYFVKTGLYAGDITYKGLRFKITPADKYKVLYHRMLNFANDILIDNQPNSIVNSDVSFDLLSYMFVLSLEKTAMLGLPQEYLKKKDEGVKFKGTVDINNYIRRNIPFMGKVSYIFREHQNVQEIVDVLYCALSIVRKSKIDILPGRLVNIYTALKESYSGKKVNKDTIFKALNHKSLQNPAFIRYKQVLHYAELIIQNNGIESAESDNNKISGYLIDVSELFEIYLEKLLRKSFTDWSIKTQEKLKIYKGSFFEREIRPDIVMEKEGKKVVVLDAKFKKMRFDKEDVDREDLFQIHTYISYYGDNVVCGGLLYPLSKPIDKDYISNLLFGNEKNKTKFIIDGVYADSSTKELIEQEELFIKRIKSHIDIE